MSGAFYTVRPTGAWLEAETPADARRSRWTFKASWTDTLNLLERELWNLRARDVVLQVAVQEREIRIDGMLRADARPTHPGVRVSFNSMHGALTYATDSCEFWQHNVRSIALGLEALRAVDRYGVTKRGEQYTGWKQLGAGTGATASHMTSAVAAQLLRGVCGGLYREGDSMAQAFRRARALSHPDRHDGDRGLWDQVEQAGRVLGVLS